MLRVRTLSSTLRVALLESLRAAAVISLTAQDILSTLGAVTTSPGDPPMKPIRLTLLSAALIALASGSPGQDKPPAAPAAQAKLVKYVWFPRFSPDGSMVLAANGSWAGNEGGEARLFSAKDGKVLHVFPHPRGVRTVAWSPKGTLFVTGGYGFGIRGFDAKDRKEVFKLAGNRQVENLRITSDDKHLIASFGNGDVTVYSLPTQKEVQRFDAVHKGGVWGMALAPNDKLLSTGGKDNMLNVFDLAAKKKLYAVKHPGEINGQAFSPDSRLLATGCTDSRIRIFDVKTGEPVAMFKAHDGGSVTDLQFTSDGKLLASSGNDGTVRVWDVSDAKSPTQKKLLKVADNLVFGVAISPDDRRLVSASWDDQVKMWDLKTDEVVWTWKRD
jgi:WD40 repeat protein